MLKPEKLLNSIHFLKCFHRWLCEQDMTDKTDNNGMMLFITEDNKIAITDVKVDGDMCHVEFKVYGHAGYPGGEHAELEYEGHVTVDYNLFLLELISLSFVDFTN